MGLSRHRYLHFTVSSHWHLSLPPLLPYWLLRDRGAIEMITLIGHNISFLYQLALALQRVPHGIAGLGVLPLYPGEQAGHGGAV